MCEMREVPNRYNNGYRFFVSHDSKEAYGLNPKGRKTKQTATPNSNPNCKCNYNAKRKQRYLKFNDAFGRNKGIYVAHAVYLAWGGRIPKGKVLDHLNGITTDNDFDNLQAVTPAENYRRMKYQHYLRKYIPGYHIIFKREDYLRFFAMPFGKFVATLDKFLHTDPFERMDKEMTRHREW